ncbi:similar to uroporphyrin-III C-methyltransferase [Cyanidioschyzon merolae strain 10D]|uniref:uroporphyrinogen-III C-methyltransferase n=1 Tax=Cyanidioschyzon merolae (strain NIES-3377 / 10D) TaxID=280699 RepID=M1V6F4_CYAM1|nr:similar to uroporphyrin-III C-methyltransferase [Cyanidioschyzon merolae strain 10D]BAM78874.1 similar to uroporphyrin-III C-methyltransferase [Cyanidioschyzon merolae strain 10D]|eukprot:XP_005535160.1 similar to uroporphyrin-III C-methyltransferase [Cyanidioschyzon merolae strain 10D]
MTRLYGGKLGLELCFQSYLGSGFALPSTFEKRPVQCCGQPGKTTRKLLQSRVRRTRTTQARRGPHGQWPDNRLAEFATKSGKQRPIFVPVASAVPPAPEYAVPGTVYLVGAGPGAYELLTLRACSLLRTADVVLYDDLAQGLISEELWNRLNRNNPPSLTLCVGKQRYKQREINELMVHQAKNLNRSVLRLKCGDPSLFGRLHEEVAALRESQIPYVVVPGVSSCTAAPIAAGIFLTERQHGRSVLLLSGHDASEIPYEAAACAADTLVLLMVGRNLSAVAARLLDQLSPNVPVALCSTVDGLQWRGTLQAAATGEATQFLVDAKTGELRTTVAVIGAVVQDITSPGQIAGVFQT